MVALTLWPLYLYLRGLACHIELICYLYLTDLEIVLVVVAALVFPILSPEYS